LAERPRGTAAAAGGHHRAHGPATPVRAREHRPAPLRRCRARTTRVDADRAAAVRIPGTLGPEHGRTLARPAADRNDAGYNVSAVFRDGDAREDRAQAHAFVAAVRELLADANAGPAPCND